MGLGIAAGSVRHTGTSRLRVEDAALLSGAGQFVDDLAEAGNLAHAAILRSSEPHALIRFIDVARARALPGVHAVLTGEDVRGLSSPLVVGVKLPMECWPIAIDRVRYFGEPVAIVVACDRYVAEDALDLIEIDYDPLPPVVTPQAALDAANPPLHEAVGSNLVNERRFSYGDPDTAFATATHRIAVSISYPRNAVTP
jgi:2-furoyl-CoA dehydrogenase large subunit